MTLATIYFRKAWATDEAHELMAQFRAIAARHGFVNQRGDGDLPSFIASIVSGEAGIMLFEDDDYYGALPELRTMRDVAHGAQVRELLEQLLQILPMDADDD